jgi:glycosyltransferase involved in cell wall biosynthesis
MIPKLWLIIPCYNEQEVLERTMELLSQKLEEMIRLGLISSESRIVFVDDGSTDSTWKIIQERYETDKMFDGIKLPRNCGQQQALMAGMAYACGECDCIISLDADLQDDINVFPDFIEKYKQGYHVVYGVRNDRSTDSWLKEHTAMLFYSLMNRLGTDIVRNHSEYRLLSDKALRALMEYKDSNLFLRYIIPRLGFDGAIVYYARQKREAGQTKYSVWKMVHLAMSAIISSQIHNRKK